MIDRAEFLARRKSGIGGSDVAAVLGLSPWRSPLDVFYDKTNSDSVTLIPTAEPQGETRSLYWGAVLEAEIAKAYSIVTGRRVMRYNRMLRHPQHQWAIGDVDRLVYCENGKRPFVASSGAIVTDRGVECKTARFKSEEWGDEGSDVVPVYYYLQVQWYMGICPALQVFDIPVLFGGSDFQIFTVARNDDIINKIFLKAEEYWNNYIVAKVPPPPRTFEEVKKLNPVADLPKMTASVEFESIVRQLAETTAKRKEAEASEAKLKFDIAARMGKAELAELPDGTPLCTFKNSKNGDRRLVVKIK